MISKVTTNLYRGSRITEKDMPELRKLGITCIINLEKHSAFSVLDDKIACRRLKADFFNLPMNEWKRPTKFILQSYVTCIELLLQYGYKIYLHCKHGRDRTGFVIAAFREIIENWSFKEAYKECLNMGHSKWLLWWNIRNPLKGVKNENFRAN